VKRVLTLIEALGGAGADRPRACRRLAPFYRAIAPELEPRARPHPAERTDRDRDAAESAADLAAAEYVPPNSSGRKAAVSMARRCRSPFVRDGARPQTSE